MDPVASVPAEKGVDRREERDLQQVHAILGTDTFGADDPRRWAMGLTVAALGGGMSSRLFQRVREELGLCYAIYAWHSSYRSTGSFGVYVGTQPGSADKAIETINEELARVAANGIPEQELTDTKSQLKGQLMLALESTTSRMSRLASHVLNDNKYRTLDELIQLVDSVTPEETAAVSAEFLNPKRMNSVRLGPSR